MAIPGLTLDRVPGQGGVTVPPHALRVNATDMSTADERRCTQFTFTVYKPQSHFIIPDLSQGNMNCGNRGVPCPRAMPSRPSQAQMTEAMHSSGVPSRFTLFSRKTPTSMNKPKNKKVKQKTAVKVFSERCFQFQLYPTDEKLHFPPVTNDLQPHPSCTHRLALVIPPSPPLSHFPVSP